MSRNYDDSRDQSNKDFDKQLEIDNAVEKEAKRNEGLPENTYFIDGIFLPVKIVPINNTEKCCRKCRGSGDTCDNGGSFVYCIVLNHYAMQDSGLDVSGGSNVGCNNFRPLEEHPSTIQSEVENIAGEVYKNLVDGNVKDFAISHFKTGFTHPQKPSGEWYSREQMIGFVVWNKMYLREQEHKVLTMPYGADRKLAAIAYTNLCNSIAQLLDLYIASLSNENKEQ